jgi:hypothetical protein
MAGSDMIEQNQNNPPVGNFEEAEQLDDDFIPNDAQPLCPKCLRPSHPLQHYCDNCDSNAVINPLTPYMPFLNIRFNYGGFCIMWRKIWYEKDTSTKYRLFYLFMIIIFAPVILIVGLPVLLIGQIIKNPELRGTATTAFLVLAFLLLMAYVIILIFSGFPLMQNY